MTSSSDRAANSKQQLTTLSAGVAIQLSEVKRGGISNDVLDLRGARKTERDLEDDDDDKIHTWDDTKEFDPERSFEIAKPAQKHSKKHHSRGMSEVDFSVSAISYSDGKGGRRDAEYDIDIVDDLDDRPRHHRKVSGISPARGYGREYPPNAQPFVQTQNQSQNLPPVPIALTTDDAVPSPSSTEQEPYFDQNEYTTFPPPALSVPPRSVPQTSRSNPVIHDAYNMGSTSLPSPSSTSSSQAPQSSGFFGALRRSGSQAGRLNLGFGPGRSTTPALAPGGDERDRQTRRNGDSRSRSPARVSRGVFGGLFGNGVLVQQQVTVVTDPEPESNVQQQNGRSRVDSEARSRGRL